MAPIGPDPGPWCGSEALLGSKARDAEVTQSRDGRTTFAEGRGELTMADGRSYRNRRVMRMSWSRAG